MDNFTINASIIMTVISLLTFLGIVCWTYVVKRSDDFMDAAQLPFNDDAEKVS